VDHAPSLNYVAPGRNYAGRRQTEVVLEVKTDELPKDSGKQQGY